MIYMKEVVTNCDNLARLKFSPHLPYAFTEHGTLMLANVLNGERAAQTSVMVVRVFVKLRQMLSSNAELARKAGIAGEEIRCAVQSCVRYHPAVNVSA